MATAHEEQQQPPSSSARNNPYDNGEGEGYGKFRKKPFRKSHKTTPYNRPPTALRNPNNNNRSGNLGWLSKIVDPAQRLITSGAHRLFASVFRKRLTAPPTNPPPPTETRPHLDHHQEPKEDRDEARDDRPEPSVSDPSILVKGLANNPDMPSTSTSHGGLVELEQILQHKTFTRSEIDRLTALLHLRSVDTPTKNDEKRSEVISLKHTAIDNRTEENKKTFAKESGGLSQLASTPARNSNVHDDDIASPAELAKAYMGSIPSKVSPSLLGLRSQALREDSAVLSDSQSLSKSPIMAVVPRSSGHVGFVENGFVTPRSRGRSAIYSMARTPYSRVQTPASSKSVGPSVDGSYLPSSSQNAWEQSRLSGSRGALKRRSTFLENDIGSVGPIRRIRQKSNLLPSRNLSVSVSGTPVFMHRTSTNSERPSSSTLGELKHGSTRISAEHVINSSASTSFTPVPTKSSEVATRILEQLDKLVSSKEKSPSKLSSSMLHGPALKSLDNIDSSNVLGNALGKNKMDVVLSTPLSDARDSKLQKQSKVEENGPTNSLSLFGKPAFETNGMEITDSAKNILPGVRIRDAGVVGSVANQHSQKKRAFHMSAHEDYLDLDDEDHSNGVITAPLAEENRNLDSVVMENNKGISSSGAIAVEKPPPSSEVVPSSTSMLNQEAVQVTASEAIGAGKSVGFTIPAGSLFNAPAQPTIVASKSASVSTAGDNDVLLKEQTSPVPKIGDGSNNVSVVPPSLFSSPSKAVAESLSTKATVSSDLKPFNPISFSSVTPGATASGADVPNSDKTDAKESPKNGIFFRPSESTLPSTMPTSSSAAGVSAFSVPSSSLSLNNGSISSSFSSGAPSLVSGNAMVGSGSSAGSTSDKAVNINSNTNNPATMFKIPSSAATPPKPVATSAELVDTKIKEASFGNLGSTPLGGTTFATVNTGNGSFGTPSAAVASTESSIFGGTSSALNSAGSTIFAGTSAISNNGSNAFGVTTSANPSTGNGIFGATAAISSTAGSPFTFSAATATSQSAGSAPSSSGSNAQPATGAGFASSTLSTSAPFGSSTSSQPFGLASSAAFSSSGSPFSSSASTNMFSSGYTFGSSSAASSFSSGANTASGLCYNWQAPKSSVFAPTSSSSPSYAFEPSSGSMGATSSTPSFGSTTGASSLSSVFPFTSTAPATSVFGNAGTAGTFTSVPSGYNNDNNMNMEDSMAEDTVQGATPVASVFSKPPMAAPVFSFGTGTPPANTPFQFGGAQQNNPFQANLNPSPSPFQANPNPNQSPSPFQANPNPSPSPFQASSSLEFNAGGTGFNPGGSGSFSLGSGGGGDKSNRRIVKINRNKQRKK